MLKELCPTPIEKELRFSLWCRNNGIKRFLLDKDDTICGTKEVYRDKINLASNFLGKNVPILSRDQWKEMIETYNNNFYEKYAVDPHKWDMVVDELDKLYKLPEKVVDNVKQIFSQIFLTPPEMLKGSEEGLAFLVKTNMPIGIVTHADREWTRKKYDWLNLERYINWDEIYTVDVKKHKTSESWLNAIRYFGLKPEECAVVGDSPRTDINAAWDIGVKNCFWVKRPNQWITQNQQINDRVRIIENLSQIIDVIYEDI